MSTATSGRVEKPRHHVWPAYNAVHVAQSVMFSYASVLMVFLFMEFAGMPVAVFAHPWAWVWAYVALLAASVFTALLQLYKRRPLSSLPGFNMMTPDHYTNISLVTLAIMLYSGTVLGCLFAFVYRFEDAMPFFNTRDEHSFVTAGSAGEKSVLAILLVHWQSIVNLAIQGYMLVAFAFYISNAAHWFPGLGQLAKSSAGMPMRSA